jgi:hypothetical protein
MYKKYANSGFVTAVNIDLKFQLLLHEMILLDVPK